MNQYKSEFEYKLKKPINYLCQKGDASSDKLILVAPSIKNCETRDRLSCLLTSCMLLAQNISTNSTIEQKQAENKQQS